MKAEVRISEDGRTLTVRVPISLRRRGGRKVVITPDGFSGWVPPRPRVDSALVKALARAFRWRKLLETGAYGTVDEIAEAEKINDSYVSRILRMTVLAPDIIESILDGKQPPSLQMHSLMTPLPMDWDRQRRALGFAAGDRASKSRFAANLR